ncbi:hypothetical protein MKW98_032673 [Papaver atlanticum]|uniref:Conserved oligomeric Golgi complex subunit 4 n=1 Tax=Papaver atlanticum TaxID=357466 RepID=A0AAD4SWM4_9MAGN|nr:hypothetical protein MKW98_032673 [Papaver atlanticum]
MTRLLHECIAYQRNLDLELENLLSQRTDLEKKTKQFTEKSDQDSGKVRELDLAQSRVYSTLSRIDAIVERGNCIEGAKKSIETEDYESAAKFVQTFLKIDEKFSDSNGSDDQREQLLDSNTKLEGIVRKKLSNAVDERDHSTIMRFIMLFPLLGPEEEGLQVYVNYLKESNLNERIDQNQGRDFVDCLTSLFKDIVLAVEENDDILRNLCGEDGIVYAIIELQEECDSRGSLVLRKYMEFRKLSRNILSVGATEGPDPREVELYLEEILTLTQLGKEYSGFMVSKIRGLRSVDPKLGPRATKAFRSGSFSKVVQEITGFYVILEEFFMVENVRKVIKIDEHVPDSLPTSMVDDVFYVLQSCCRRDISTSSMNSVLAILFLGGVDVQKTGTEIATALNNIDVSGEYVLKLRHGIEEHCAERKKIKSCLSELGEMSTGFKLALNAGIEQLVEHCSTPVFSVTPRIRPMLDMVGTVSYELSEAEYKLLHAVETNAAWLQLTMTSSNYVSFVHLIIDFIVKRLEVIMMLKKFNQLGGLQLDRDARALMATILNLEKVSEILDFWGENARRMTWRLTPAEVRRVLGLRVDFRPEAIAALRL